MIIWVTFLILFSPYVLQKDMRVRNLKTGSYKKYLYILHLLQEEPGVQDFSHM